MTARRVFWLLLLLAVVGAFHYRRVGFDVVNFGYKFGRLHLAKKLVTTITAGPDTIHIYVETYLESADLIKSEQMETIAEEAYGQYRPFLEKHYAQIVGDFPDNWYRKKAEEINFVFVRQTTFVALKKINPPVKEIEKHFIKAYLGFFNTIYFEISDNINPRQAQYLIDKELKPIIRHEIFHYLNNRYGLTAEFEETAAKRFGNF